MEKGSDAQVDRQSKTVGNTLARKRAANRIALSDVRKFKRDGNVSEALKPIAEMATVEVRALIEQLGGRRGGDRSSARAVRGLSGVGTLWHSADGQRCRQSNAAVHETS